MMVASQHNNQQQFMAYLGQQREFQAREEARRAEGNLKIKQELPSITAKNEEVLVEEYLTFDTRVSEARVTDARSIYYFFKGALVDPGKIHLEAYLVTVPGMALRQSAETTDTPEAWRSQNDPARTS